MTSSTRSVLIAVSHGLYEPWLDILHNGQEETWLKADVPQSLQILHFHGTPTNRLIQLLDRWHERLRWSGINRARALRVIDRFFFWPWMGYIPKYQKSRLLNLKGDGRVLHIKSPDTYVTYRWKELALFDYFINQTDLDYLFITTTSSYVSYTELIKFVATLPRNGTYVGARPYPEASFVSGSCRFMSRDVIEFVLSNKRRFDVAVIEDMSLGDLIQSGGFNPSFIQPNNFSSLDELISLGKTELSDKFHFRLKSFVDGKRNDVVLMKLLHQKLNGEV